jgi:lipopolysaccharide transport system permease protein
MTQPGSVSELARKRDLWWQFTIRAVEMRHRGSYLGILWSVLNPLLMLGVYVVVFGIIFGGRFGVLPDETHTDFVLAVFLGLTFFHLVAETMAAAPTMIVINPNLVKKVVFPLEVLPLSQLGSFWFHFFISLMLMLGGAAFFGRGLPLTGLLWLPAILLPLLLLSIGLGWLLAALGVFFRDLAQVMPFATQVLLYASAIFYPLGKIPAGIWIFLRWNPLLHIVQLARGVLLWNLPVNGTHLAYVYGCGLAMFFFGRWVFGKLQPAFADVI